MLSDNNLHNLSVISLQPEIPDEFESGHNFDLKRKISLKGKEQRLKFS
jgi:hypothetical protein